LLFVKSRTPVSTPVKVTRAPAITAPVGSSIVPATVPRLVCAFADTATRRSAASVSVLFSMANPMAAKTKSREPFSCCMSFPLLLSVEYQTSLITAPFRILCIDLHNEFFWPLTQSHDDSGRFTARAIVKNLDGPAIQPPRGLGSRTSGFVEGSH